jgi:hypothetical protein
MRRNPTGSHTRFPSITRSIRALSLVALISVAGATRCDAQNPGYLRPDEQACRSAARIVETGRPSKTEAMAGWIIRECGGAIAGNAAASATSALRRERDVSVLAEGTSPFWGLQDTAFYRAARQVAGDRSASPEARAVAIRSILGMLYQGVYAVSYASLMSDGDDCQLAGHTGTLPPDGTGLPANTEAQVRKSFTAIAADDGEPASVRSAAACALGMIRR